MPAVLRLVPAASRNFGAPLRIVGTIAFAVASLICWIMLDRLTETGYRDWLWICLTGTGLGVVGTAYCWQRSRH
ncbi:MAG: DUF2530 domain-containing protein [Propionibacterium sp. 4572_24]|nr:MAG: DUF2530 domain-containing protein [Propionibacterium sp. 4572_24]